VKVEHPTESERRVLNFGFDVDLWKRTDRMASV